jgi:hypothetical protein
MALTLRQSPLEALLGRSILVEKLLNLCIGCSPLLASRLSDRCECQKCDRIICNKLGGAAGRKPCLRTVCSLLTPHRVAPLLKRQESWHNYIARSGDFDFGFH